MRIDIWARRVGIALFVISFPLPDMDFGATGIVWSLKDNGFGAFLMSPIALVGIIASGIGWQIAIAGGFLAASWLTNFTVFFRLPKACAWAPIIIPWILFIMFRLEWYPNGSSISGFIPFYPWAGGIGLIHGSVYLNCTTANATRESANAD